MLGQPTPGCFHILSDQETHPAAVVDFLKRQTAPPTLHTHVQKHRRSEDHTRSRPVPDRAVRDRRPTFRCIQVRFSSISKVSRRVRQNHQEPAGHRSPNLLEKDRNGSIIQYFNLKKYLNCVYFKSLKSKVLFSYLQGHRPPGGAGTSRSFYR